MPIRSAQPYDVPEILAMIRELAEYEREPNAVVATEELLHEALFGDSPAVFGLIAE
ncbi:MAG: GNAT family N-acetyltransferase, partial [Actinomycetota bacterium]